jgi:hypothetical protein
MLISRRNNVVGFHKGKNPEKGYILCKGLLRSMKSLCSPNLKSSDCGPCSIIDSSKLKVVKFVTYFMKTCNFFNCLRRMDRQAKATIFPISFYTAEGS